MEGAQVGRARKQAKGSARPAREHALRLAEGLVAAASLVVLLEWIFGFSIADPQFWQSFVFGRGGRSPLLGGFLTTLYFAAIIIPLALVTGFLWGWMRVSGYRVLSWPATVLVELFRGVPPLVLVIFAYLFGVTILPADWNPFEAALLVAAFALALHSAAYQAEIFRAGFQAVPRGQVEAAEAIGMSKVGAMGHVVLPQALRLALPPLGNEFSSVIKDTALLAAVGASELFAKGLEFQQQVYLGGRLYWLFLLWTTIAAVYFLLNFTVTRGLLAVEARLRVPGMEGVRV